jgi:hypothetical protein
MRNGAKRNAPRRPVVVALASRSAVATALQPVLTAGIQVRSVATPAMALMSLARLRQAAAVETEGVVDAYIAIDVTETSIALVRNGTLVAARELMSGYGEGRRLELRCQEDVAARLGDELIDFLTTVGGSPQSLRHVALCGGYPELRSVAALLTGRLDVEVEPLDTLFGIDEDQLPEPSERFRVRVACARVAWAAAADTRPPLSLLHARQRQAAHARFARVAIAAGMMAGVGIGWQVAESPLLGPPAPRTVKTVREIRAIPVPKPPPVPEVLFEEDPKLSEGSAY